jgi:hypothetical protein
LIKPLATKRSNVDPELLGFGFGFGFGLMTGGFGFGGGFLGSF